MAEWREEADEDGDHTTGNIARSLKILAQINAVVTVIAGRAEMLAEQHDPARVQQLRRSVQQYKELVATLVRLMERKGHRG